jgi:superfamily II DNA or RNA helicase
MKKSLYSSEPLNSNTQPDIDFSSTSEELRVVTEAIRLSFGYLFNPNFATEISIIDPLPHQLIAVYNHMLKNPRLRFLLADDAGAGKTIMAGLYIREMLNRRLINRILVITPAGLIGNWEKELRTLFNLHFKIITGKDIRENNPFIGDNSDKLIVSIDTLAGERMFSKLKDTNVEPYDLVIFDEAHKLSAYQEPDFRIRKTERYRLAESLVGIYPPDDKWHLNWASQHILLMTATPHMGKEYPYYSLWKLLEPEILSTYDSFKKFPYDERQKYFIRRIKEEMVNFEGVPIYPERKSITLSYDLSQGLISEQNLYDQTTKYIEKYYNSAKILNRSAMRFARSIFQRRLASSTYALLCSFQRRGSKLEKIIEEIESNPNIINTILTQQKKLDGMKSILD